MSASAQDIAAPDKASVTAFFSAPENRTLIVSFAGALKLTKWPDEKRPDVSKPLRTFISVLEPNADKFDELCGANIEWVGNTFIRLLSKFVDKEDDENVAELLSDIFTICYRFLSELELSQPGDLSIELNSIKRFVEENWKNFEEGARRQLVYASFSMPIQIVKRLVHHPSLNDFKSFSETASSARQLKKAWDEEIAQKTLEQDALRDSVSQIKTQYNFVGLVKGFESLIEMKRTEKKTVFWSVFAIATMMLGLLSAELVFVFRNVDTLDAKKTILLFTAPALVALEVVLFYFFRVLLQNFRELQSQLLQLELRRSLCQFIQSYSEYSAPVKKNDPAALQRFEAIVFSNIVSDADLVPGAFDGIEQLAKLVKSVKA